MTDSLTLKLAATIITRADKSRPADSVMREELRKQHGLPREAGRAVSQAVFGYYRWKKWLTAGEPLSDQIIHALELADRFRREPDSFPDEELRQKAVPTWIHAHCDITTEVARAMQTPPVLWLRARTGRGPELAERLSHCALPGGGWLRDTLQYQGTQDLFRTEEFQAGAFELQDLHSQAVGWLCDPKAGQKWWDACAGEGGKLLHLSDLMENKGLIWASDRSEWRLKLLRQRCARAGVFNYRAVEWLQNDKPPTKTVFDGVLVDAPCSNVGTWHRNPHGRWTYNREDVIELADLQLRLLLAAATAVKPGGKLVYSVCTLTREETLGVVAEFERRYPEFTPLVVNHPFLGDEPPAATHLLSPSPGGGNGMFVALWTRKVEAPVEKAAEVSEPLVASGRAATPVSSPT